MIENLKNNDNNSNEIQSNSINININEKENNENKINNENDIFYFSELDNIPKNVKEHFKTKNDFLVVLVNPKSGSQQGKIILEYSEKYKIESIKEYKVMSFPIKDEQYLKIKEKESKRKKSKELELKDIKSEVKKEETLCSSSLNLRLIEFDSSEEFSIIIFNIIDKNDITKGKAFIKKYLLDFPENEIKIITAGGDGTVLGIVEDLKKEEVPLNRCIFGPMPFGTGNDLSNALGFGHKCKIDGLLTFQKILYTYLKSIPTKIDIWELNVKVNENNGTIYDVITKGEKIKEDINKNKILEFKKAFINYFSIGFDARVGFQFEQRRSKSRHLNKFIYGVQAAKLIFSFKKHYGLTQVLESFKEENKISNNNIEEDLSSEILERKEDKDNINEIKIEDKDEINENKKEDKDEINENKKEDKDDINEIKKEVKYNINENKKEDKDDINENKKEDKINKIENKKENNEDTKEEIKIKDKDNKSKNKMYIFRTRTSMEIPSNIVLNGNPVNLVCQNIDFYMGGTQKIWDKSNNLALSKEELNKKQEKEYCKEVLSHFQKQSFNDKKIEFFTYEHGIQLGLERISGGMAKRVYQGSGPFYLDFKKKPNEIEKEALKIVYLNCDGEFYHLENPKQIYVRLNTNINGGQINILKNEIRL